MKVEINLDKDFENKLLELEEKYGEELTLLNGFSDRQLSYTDFIDNFIDKKTVADASIDGNANVGTKDICSLESEMSKPHSKLLSFNKIYYEVKKQYGKNVADEWLENEWDGHMYMHDAFSSSRKSYCFAYDIKDLVEKGLFFIDGFNAQPPKHLVTYTDFVGEFVSYTSNRSSGACGLPSFLIYSFYFWNNDVKNGYYTGTPEKYRDQEFQRIIYKLNQPYLRINQSAFTNFSIFDKPYLESLFGAKQYPDGTFIMEHIDELIEYQKAFMNVCSNIRSQNVMTFPVLTFALLRKNGKFVDEEFAKWACKHNMKWADSNFFISEDVTSLSNCCFDGKQMCLSRSSNGVNYMTFEDLYNSDRKETMKNFSIFHNGSWVNGDIVRLNKRDMYKIITSNKKELYVTDNHIFPTYNGDKHVYNLDTNDYIMFNTRKLDTYPEKDKKLTYEQGFLIGMYLGDGSISQREGTFTPVIRLSLNKNKYYSSLDFVNKAIGEIDEYAEFRLEKECNNVYPTEIRSRFVKEFIREYVHGNYSNEKELDMNCLLQNIKFRRGILDGYYLTDGGNSNRIYTTSEKLVHQIECLMVSLGINSVIDISDRTDEDVVIRGQIYDRNYPLYCIRWYDPKNRRTQKDLFKVKNNCEYFKVVSIEKYDYNDEYVYCFEMKNEDEPYFTLPNGVITHNCRLLSDIKDLGYFNSIGGSALEVGSIKVNTINLARISYETNTKKEYIEKLKKETQLCCIVLDRVRHIIKRNIEKGLLPNYTYGLMHMDKQYNTIGIIGIYETLQKFGLIEKDRFGNSQYTKEGIEFAKDILNSIIESKDSFKCDYSFNIEQVPAERAAAVLMQKDKMFFPDEAYELPLYGNQWIPLGVKTTIKEKVRISAILDKACNGGSISHVNIGTPFKSFESAWETLNYVADSGVVYFAFCTKISACKHNHGFYGDICPECGEKKETTYQRVVGFLTPERTYSKERKEEFNMRQWFEVE